MGKIGFTPIQELIFDEFAKEQLSRNFYFTGGTALSVFYLHHRESEDLDFFSENDFDDKEMTDFMSNLAKKLRLNLRFTRRDKARIFELVGDKKLAVKVDFVHYPYKRVEKGEKYKNIAIDSTRDIGTNKLLTINQRNDIKDYVDLYYLLRKYTLWDLIYAVEAKFRIELDLILIGANFMKIEDFDFLPKMIKPLRLEDLKTFFRIRAKEIGGKIARV